MKPMACIHVTTNAAWNIEWVPVRTPVESLGLVLQGSDPRTLINITIFQTRRIARTFELLANKIRHHGFIDRRSCGARIDCFINKPVLGVCTRFLPAVIYGQDIGSLFQREVPPPYFLTLSRKVLLCGHR